MASVGISELAVGFRLLFCSFRRDLVSFFSFLFFIFFFLNRTSKRIDGCVPFSERSLPRENFLEWSEGRRILKRRPENDMLERLFVLYYVSDCRV